MGVCDFTCFICSEKEGAQCLERWDGWESFPDREGIVEEDPLVRVGLEYDSDSCGDNAYLVSYGEQKPDARHHVPLGRPVRVQYMEYSWDAMDFKFPYVDEDIGGKRWAGYSQGYYEKALSSDSQEEFSCSIWKTRDLGWVVNVCHTCYKTFPALRNVFAHDGPEEGIRSPDSLPSKYYLTVLAKHDLVPLLDPAIACRLRTVSSAARKSLFPLPKRDVHAYLNAYFSYRLGFQTLEEAFAGVSGLRTYPEFTHHFADGTHFEFPLAAAIRAADLAAIEHELTHGAHCTIGQLCKVYVLSPGLIWRLWQIEYLDSDTVRRILLNLPDSDPSAFRDVPVLFYDVDYVELLISLIVRSRTEDLSVADWVAYLRTVLAKVPDGQNCRYYGTTERPNETLLGLFLDSGFSPSAHLTDIIDHRWRRGVELCLSHGARLSGEHKEALRKVLAHRMPAETRAYFEGLLQ